MYFICLERFDLPLPLQIRSSTIEDEQFLFALYRDSHEEEFASLGSVVAPLLRMQFQARQMAYSEKFPAAEDRILCLDDETRVGRLLLDTSGSQWTLVDIAVLRTHRHKGVASEVLQDCLRECHSAGSTLVLHVAHSNPARELYLKLGFQAIHSDAVYMEMRSSPIISHTCNVDELISPDVCQPGSICR